ncbi:MAG: hypothetical protein CMD02_04010 [Flavobacteriales bacterium]|nr:hypothetical protein [Flavobacteriales bacterium]
MNEKEWVKTIISKMENDLRKVNDKLRVRDGYKLPYSSEILKYNGNDPIKPKFMKYETDILISEELGNNEWNPRVIIEAKINSITTHDAITYSKKSQTHKNVHPYLRYGILIGNRKHYPLPGRLFRHGGNFDFMISFKTFSAEKNEWDSLIKIIQSEVKASNTLEEIIFNSRSNERGHYTSLHRALNLK